MRIFIIYRRSDSSGHAGRLSDSLIAHFGSGSVFMDIDNIRIGEDFTAVAHDALSTCDAALAIIGPDWATVTDKQGRRRIDDPGDHVRVELADALARDIRVVPVLVHGAEMPGVRDLPPELSAFAYRNAFDLSDLRWRSDVGNLCEALSISLASQSLEVLPNDPALVDATVSDSRAVEAAAHGHWARRRVAYLSSGVLALLGTALALVLVTTSTSSPPEAVRIVHVSTATGDGTLTASLPSTADADRFLAVVATYYQDSIVLSESGVGWKHVSTFASPDSGTGSGQRIEVWTATPPVSVFSPVVISSTSGPQWAQSLTIYALSSAGGVDVAGSACFAPVGCIATSPAPMLTVIPQHTGSIIVGVGYDVDNKFARAPGTGQTLDEQGFDQQQYATMWTQHADRPAVTNKPVTLSDSSAGSGTSFDRWALLAVEVAPGDPSTN
ncbi:MAG TPA: toll/interleukin-1 receptor domain-containing protein [Acidimicrobiales bacterium]|nr:toll/interleukin-1 receptor domain-containing protein [Acidimicrobiales bacterium]